MFLFVLVIIKFTS